MRAPAIQPPPPPRLTDRELDFLRYGPRDDADDDAFADEAAARAAWEENRESILAWYQSGRRPWAWRAFDRPDVSWRGYAREQSILWAAGVLGAEEKVAVERLWFNEFTKAQDANFFHCLGPDRFLKGDEARKAHYRAVDIPSELIRRWERRQRKESPSSATAEGAE
jgi:hypothetical protein